MMKDIHKQNATVPEGWVYAMFEEFINKRKEKHNCATEKEDIRCFELEHIEAATGRLIGSVSSLKQKSIKNRFKSRDVVFGKLRPYLRKFFFAKMEGIASSETWVLSFKENMGDNLFLYYLVQTDDFIERCNRTTGTKMPRADWALLSKEVFLFPAINEQRKIAKLLYTWDKRIECLSKLLEAKRKVCDGLIEQLCSGKVRLSGYKKEWKMYEIGALGKFSKGKGVSKDQLTKTGFPCVRYGDIYTKHNFFIKNFYSFIPDEVARESREIRRGTVLFAGSGETLEDIGKAIAYDGEMVAYAGGDVIILEVKRDINSIFLSLALNTNKVKQQIRRIGEGHSVVHLYASDLKHIKVFLPEKSEQDAIADFLKVVDKEIEILGNELTCLKYQKTALIKTLLTGQKRIAV